jgi:hypothetical protein
MCHHSHTCPYHQPDQRVPIWENTPAAHTPSWVVGADVGRLHLDRLRYDLLRRNDDGSRLHEPNIRPSSFRFASLPPPVKVVRHFDICAMGEGTAPPTCLRRASLLKKCQHVPLACPTVQKCAFKRAVLHVHRPVSRLRQNASFASTERSRLRCANCSAMSEETRQQ